MLHLLAAALLHYDVLISAGHEGRPESCARFPKRHCNLGTSGERSLTPAVADEATRKLRALGYSVAREPADFDGTYDVKAAIFIHFDGTDRPCTSAASIGYHTGASKPAADLWRKTYGRIFPFGFMADNFTNNLRDYYGFRQVHAQDAGLVLELGELTCPAQRAWLVPHLQLEGDTIANFVDQVVRQSAADPPPQMKAAGSDATPGIFDQSAISEYRSASFGRTPRRRGRDGRAWRRRNRHLALRVAQTASAAKSLLLSITQNPVTDQDNDFLTDVLRLRTSVLLRLHDSKRARCEAWTRRHKRKNSRRLPRLRTSRPATTPERETIAEARSNRAVPSARGCRSEFEQT